MLKTLSTHHQPIRVSMLPALLLNTLDQIEGLLKHDMSLSRRYVLDIQMSHIIKSLGISFTKIEPTDHAGDLPPMCEIMDLDCAVIHDPASALASTDLALIKLSEHWDCFDAMCFKPALLAKLFAVLADALDTYGFSHTDTTESMRKKAFDLINALASSRTLPPRPADAQPNRFRVALDAMLQAQDRSHRY